MNQSSFIRERFFNDFNKFDTKVLEKGKNFAGWITGVLDEAGTKLIWNAEHNKAVSQGIPDAVKFADDATRRMVAGRGIGEVPINQKAKTMQLVAPFQLEVQNLWYVFHDWKIDKKLIPKMIQYSLYAYLFNTIAEGIRGSRVTFDPINAAVEGVKSFNKEDNKIKGAEMAAGRIGGEVLKNTMGGQTAANMYPEFGLSVFGHKLPARKDLLGNGDPTRFGSGGISDIMTKGVQDPMYKLIPSFGGGQLKKTIDGTSALIKGYAENGAGKVMTPVEQNVPNIMKGVLFGKNSLNEVKNYYDTNQLPLSDQQSEKYKLMGNDPKYFDGVMTDRKANQELKSLKGGKAEGDSKSLSDGMYQLSNGKIYVKDLKATYKSVDEANSAIKKDVKAKVIKEFEKSDKNFQDMGGYVLQKDASGKGLAKSKVKFTSELNTAKMTNAKNSKDVSTWMKLADDQYKLYGMMLKDPTIDELEKTKIQNDMDTLSGQFSKFKSYGGFTKGSSKKVEEKYRYALVDPEMFKIKNLIAGNTIRKPVVAKRPLQLIQRRLPVVHRAR
jgi:hypothetical protein